MNLSNTNPPQQATNCFSVFDCFMGLALKALSHLLFIIYLETLEQYRKKLGQDVQKNCFMLMTSHGLIKHSRV